MDLSYKLNYSQNRGTRMATIAEVLVEQGRVDGLREGILESIGIVRSLRMTVTIDQVRAIYQSA